MARPKRTSQNFNSRFLALFEAGSKRELRITLGSPKEAIRFRHEANALRASLRDANHSGWQRYYEAGLYIDPASPSVVIVRPKTGDFKAALDAAGVPDFSDDPPLPPGSDTNVETSAQSIEDFMADLRKLR